MLFNVLFRASAASPENPLPSRKKPGRSPVPQSPPCPASPKNRAAHTTAGRRRRRALSCHQAAHGYSMPHAGLTRLKQLDRVASLRAAWVAHVHGGCCPATGRTGAMIPAAPLEGRHRGASSPDELRSDTLTANAGLRCGEPTSGHRQNPAATRGHFRRADPPSRRSRLRGEGSPQTRQDRRRHVH